MSEPSVAPSEAPERPARRHDRGLQALLAFAGASMLLLAGSVLYAGLALRCPRSGPGAAAAAAGGDAGLAARRADPDAWAALPATSALAAAADVAFASGAALSTDGRQATLDLGEGAPRPLEVPAAIGRVFAGAGRLFAYGENDGAPFLILLAPPLEDPLVVPLPCPVTRLAGEGSVLAGACADQASLAVSADGGKSFRPVPLQPPAPGEAGSATVQKEIEAVAASTSGSVAAAVAQRWQSDQLLWTWSQMGARDGPGRPFRFVNVHALVRTVGLHLAGGTVTLAGLEVALDGPAEGQTRPRLYRAAEGDPPAPVGEPGPPCGSAAQAQEVEGLLMGERIAAFRCGPALALTYDGGATWKSETGLGQVHLLRGGDMRLFARSGEKAFERRFVNRSVTGATAVRVSASSLPRRDAGEPGPLSLVHDIREPVPDGGAGDASE